jgi:hypothetical protein
MEPVYPWWAGGSRVKAAAVGHSDDTTPGASHRLHTQTQLTHDDAVAERSSVLELQGLEDVPKLLRHGGLLLALLACLVEEVEVQSTPSQRRRRRVAMPSEIKTSRRPPAAHAVVRVAPVDRCRA